MLLGCFANTGVLTIPLDNGVDARGMSADRCGVMARAADPAAAAFAIKDGGE
jgi:hypothetical protein